MRQKRTRKPKFPRLLDKSPEIIAVVDQCNEIIFANAACCQWLELSSEEVLGQRLEFRSGRENPRSAAGLCPPPDLFVAEGGARAGEIFSDAGGQRTWKQAQFTLIHDDQSDYRCILIIGWGIDSANPNQPSDRNDWHQILADLKIEDAKFYSRHSLVGVSPYANRLRKQLNAVVANQSDCLIVGPNGSGKEHLARCIFYGRNSNQNNVGSTLVPIHCAIADSVLIQNSIKEWVFEQQESGNQDWLLLLGVDLLSAESQTELLGYAQMPGFRLRVISTAEHDLEVLADSGQYLKELAFHLSIQRLNLKKLSDRREDIPLLCQYFVEQFNARNKKNVGRVTDEVIELFLEYNWPGNLDELKHIIDLAMNETNGSIIDTNDLPPIFLHSLAATRIGREAMETIQLDEFLGGIEKELISRAIKISKNNRTKAAEILGISRAKLLRRAAALGIIPSSKKQDAELIDESAFQEAD